MNKKIGHTQPPRGPPSPPIERPHSPSLPPSTHASQLQDPHDRTTPSLDSRPSTLHTANHRRATPLCILARPVFALTSSRPIPCAHRHPTVRIRFMLAVLSISFILSVLCALAPPPIPPSSPSWLFSSPVEPFFLPSLWPSSFLFLPSSLSLSP